MIEQNPELTPAQVIEILEENTLELTPELPPAPTTEELHQKLQELEQQKAQAKDKAQAKLLRAKIRAIKVKLGIPVQRLVKEPKAKARKPRRGQSELETYREQLAQAEQLLETQAQQIIFLKQSLSHLLDAKAITKAQVREMLEQVDKLPAPEPEAE